jgi:hypothetical protein
MALTNIELYEALKKDLNEDAAKMIAEVVPAASELATREFIERRIAESERRMVESERRVTQNMFRMFLAFVGPLYVALTAEVVRLVLRS